MPAVAKERSEKEVKRGKVETADTYLGLASKVLTSIVALGTLSFWLYTTFYVGTLDIRPDKNIASMTIKLYDERGSESIYHTGRVKVTPGHYQIVAEADDAAPARMEADVKFNGTTVVPYAVQEEQEEVPVEQPAAEDKSNRRWWQIWKRN